MKRLFFIFTLLSIFGSFTAQTTTLNHDSNNDGCVNLNDLLDLISEYGQCLSTSFTCGDAISHEGYDYSTVLIGGQCWFSENCRYLPSVSPSSAESDVTPYYYVYGYEGTDVVAAQATANYATFGVLYNFEAAITPGLCPAGWHVPTDLEWQTMEMSLGMSAAEASSSGWRGTDQGTQIKSTSGWTNGGNGTNSSGFNGLPGGYRSAGGGFNDISNNGFWWSSSASGSPSAWYRVLFFSYPKVNRYDYYLRLGFSARCVMD